ncbi:hypothetical protein Tco_0938733 [Tanacetum coccineum]|uniref:Uncharacterized protein n=1 Tax=Tanacetum coccineum TaxID=301880 RepID=A0ABQ5DJU6_9ASTR
MAEEIKKLVEGTENVEENVVVVSLPLRNDDNQTNPGTRLEPRSYMESPEVEKIADISQPVNVIEEEEELAEDDYELKRREKRKHVEETRHTPSPITIRSPRIQSTLMVDERIKKILQTQVPSQVDSSARSYMSGHLQQDDLPIWLALKYKFETLHMATTPCRPSAVRPRDQDDPQDDAHLKGENSAKRQKTSEHGMFVFVESSSNDDVLSNGKVSQELMDEMSQTVDEAKLRKVVDEMLRQQCTSGDEHQYHIDQMQNFLKSDIMWGSKKEIIVPPYQPKPTLVTYWELGHEHKFITEIVARRANKCIVSITKSDYKNLNKNNIEDMYLLIINHKVDDYVETGLLCSLSVFIKSTVIWDRVHDFQLGVESYQQQVNLTTSTITFPSIKKYKMFSIVFEPVYGIIYKNNKKEKTVMRHQEVYKFCDATLKRVLEGLKSYNNNVKYGYVTHNLSKEDVEYLQMFPHEIEERFKYHDQMRRWEMYVNKRPLGSRRERPE